MAVVVTVVVNDAVGGVETDAAVGEETDGEFCEAGEDDAAANASAADFFACGKYLFIKSCKGPISGRIFALS